MTGHVEDISGAGWLGSAAAYCRMHPTELLAYILDLATAILVVAVQDIAFKEAITSCAVLSVVSFLCNWDSYNRGQRVVFPKSIEVMVPALCVALVAPAWLHERATHRIVYLVICGTAAATMLFTVAIGRSFAMEYFMDWYPRQFWSTPLVRRLTTHLAWTWILAQLIMAASAAVIIVEGDSNEVLYITLNYVMQILPLAVAVIATVVYPKVLKRRWGYDPEDITTGYPPWQRGKLPPASLAGQPAPPAPCGAGGGRRRAGWLGGGEGGSGSRLHLLGSFLSLGDASRGSVGNAGETGGADAAAPGAESEAAAGTSRSSHGNGAGSGSDEQWQRQQEAPGSGSADLTEVLVSPMLTPTRRGAGKGSGGGGGDSNGLGG